MNKMQKFVIVLASIIGLSSQAEWSYDYETQWPGVCRSGDLQSPINIMTRSALLDKHEAHIRGPLVLRGYGDVTVTAENNGHTLRWNKVEGTPAPTVSGGPLRGNYSFMQFHLHWLSEHAIDGMKYPLEIHMVHVKTGLTVDQAVLRPDGLAVIGVLAQVRSDDESYFALEEIMPVVPELVDKTNRDTEPKNIDLRRLMSAFPQSYYTYHGSLTTPNCQEVVTWIVMDRPISISDTQYKSFSKVNVGGIDNYRSLQTANRVVYRSAASCSSIMLPSFLGTFAGFLNCLSSSLNLGIAKGICLLGNIKRKLFGRKVTECDKIR